MEKSSNLSIKKKNQQNEEEEKTIRQPLHRKLKMRNHVKKKIKLQLLQNCTVPSIRIGPEIQRLLLSGFF